MPIPLKIAGREISVIVPLIAAMSTPSVVFERATHLYSTILVNYLIIQI